MKKVLMLVMVLCLGFGLTGVANALVIGLEAEPSRVGSDSITAPFTVDVEWRASDARYIGTDTDLDDENGAPPAAGRVTWTFDAPAGTYKLMWRVRVLDGSNSFWTTVPGATYGVDQVTRGDNWWRYNGLDTADEWRWYDVINDQGDGDPVVEFTFAAGGSHTIIIAYREAGAQLDGIVITDDLALDPDAMPDYIPNDERASAVDPANLQTGVALTGAALEWSNPLALTSYTVYFGTEPPGVGDPNADDLIVGNVDATMASVDDLYGPLAVGTIYYWRAEPRGPVAPNTPGRINVFESYSNAPYISEQPEDVDLYADCTAVFTIAATAGADSVTYEWFDSLDVSVETVDTLVTTVPGDYYCVVTNTATAETATSNTATFTIHPVDLLGSLTQTDLGNPYDGQPQSFTVNGDGSINVVAGGNDIWGDEDRGLFVHSRLLGDGEISAKVTLINGDQGNGWIKVGVMMRDNLSHNSAHSFMCMTARQGISWQGRRVNGTGLNGSAQPNGDDYTVPVWVKIVRQGAAFTGYYSYDGENWTLGASDTNSDAITNPLTHPYPLTGPVYVGLAATSHDNAVTVPVLYEDIKLIAYGVSNPTPADGATGIDPTSEIVLGWDAAASAPCPAEYDVRVDDDPNLNDAAPVRVTDPTLGIAGGTYGNDATVYWSVDVVGGTGAGSVWSFDTIKINPDITAQPEDTFVPAGQNASFTIAADRADSLQWYGPAGAIGGATGATLTLTGVGAADEGAYYCVATNTNGDAQSDSANLDVGFLIHHWPLDEIAGTEPNLIVEDVAGDLDGVPAGETGGVGVVPGIIGNAYDLNNEGMLGYIDIDDSIGKLSSFSVSVWLNYHDDIDNLDSILHHDGWSNSYMHFHTRPDGRVTNAVNGVGGGDLYTLGNLGGGNTPGTWYHVVLTYDVAAGQRIFYLDGSQDAIQNRSDFIDAELFPGNIGAYNNDPGNRHWDGLMDDFRIYDYPLSRAEVAALYHAVFPDAAICVDPPDGDLDGDCEVTLNDFAIWAIGFGWCDIFPASECP